MTICLALTINGRYHTGCISGRATGAPLVYCNEKVSCLLSIAWFGQCRSCDLGVWRCNWSLARVCCRLLCFDWCGFFTAGGGRVAVRSLM